MELVCDETRSPASSSNQQSQTAPSQQSQVVPTQQLGSQLETVGSMGVNPQARPVVYVPTHMPPPQGVSWTIETCCTFFVEMQ